MQKGMFGLGRAAAAVAACGVVALLAAACGSSVASSTGTTGTTAATTTTGAGGMSGGTGGSTASSGGNGGGNGGTGNVEPKCTGNADCANDPKGKVCDTGTGQCVQCTAADDQCMQGQYCDSTTNTCKVGCTDAADCNNGGAPLVCNTDNHTCVGCVADTDCALGTICFNQNSVCVPGCSPAQGCQAGFTCCGSACFDLTASTKHCGSCDKDCTAGVNPPATCGDGTCDPGDANNPAENCANCPDDCACNAAPVCNAGMCALAACDAAYADCNGDLTDGCEWNILQDGPCLCAPGSTQGCYNGGPGTIGKGPCVGGTQTCDATGTAWGPCVGQVLPKSELCANNVDEDCNGVVDDVPDLDGDGWTACEGDCCDVAGPNCGSPKLVNPGAFEVVGNSVDDDCDPASSDVNAPASCSNAAKFANVAAGDMANAMDICQVTSANAPKPTRKWGLINASFRLANGSVPAGADMDNIRNWQAAIIQNYGTGGIVPHKGATMAGISSGRMRDINDPGFVAPVGGSSFASAISFGPPAPGAPLGTYTAAHNNGLLPGQCGAMSCPVGTGANDSVNVRLQIRVPTNAQSFSYDFRFFSGEYQSFQCTSFNDYYLAMLTTGAPGIPADQNISFDANGKAVSVNNGFFQVCGGNGKNCGACPNGVAELVGTGMDSVNGGGTAWLTTDAPIVPGETMVLELMVFDVTDHIYDSLALLDNFRWALTAAVVGTHM